MNGHEIRHKFLEYFERNGHKIVHSSPLLPANDPTLLFTNAGMNQFKDVFLGNEKRDYTRAASSQKCIRAGGKHNDLDEVGKTARHHTFFEMLGNFSFGDYFKEDAIKYAWDFLVNELKLDPERLWFSVFEGDEEVPADDEARALWEKMGAKPDRILGFGRKDNFWQMGDTGPCGPCSEIHYFMGENVADNLPGHVNADVGDTTMEIWNLVFMQFVRSEISPGVFKLDPLPAPSVDTGAGLERVTAVMEGVSTNYETSLIKPIVDKAATLATKDGLEWGDGKELVAEEDGLKEKRIYDSFTEQQQFACRVIADHARSTAFAIADGILPGNEGRNYVLRKIMRRAIYNGREHLGFDGPFFHKVCDFVVGEMGGAFPELIAQRDFISKMVLLEEERFGNTMTVGLQKLAEVLKKQDFHVEPTPDYHGPYPGTVQLSELAKLYDTYGMPIDLMYVVLKSRYPTMPDHDDDLPFSFWTLERCLGSRLTGTVEKFSVVETLGYFGDDYEVIPYESIKFIDEEKFRELIGEELKELQEKSEIGKTHQADKINPIYAAMQRVSTIRSEFIGYDHTDISDVKVLALVKDSQQVESLNEGDEGLIVLDKTPFYAEAGGQVGDTGLLLNNSVNIRVLDTFAPVKEYILHKSKIENGSIKVGDTVTASVDIQKRDATRRNHTATHLVHAALREVLGTHVKQAGSVVAPNYLRFDFTHYQPMSAMEIQEIEDLVNRYILENQPVNTDLMSIEDAMRTGAMALFGEKYGGEVRVLSVGNGEFSRELCGGTHVRATGDIGTFKITNDEAIASGVRRIRAITGFDSLERFREDELLIERSLGALKTQRDNLPNAIEKLQEELKKTRKEMDELKLKIASGSIGGAAANGDEAKDVAGVKLIAKSVEGLDAGGMRQLSDNLLDKMKSGIVVLGRKEESKVSIIVRVSDDLTKRIQAGKVIGELAPIIGGRGGGKPDMAEGGGNLPDKLSEAIDASAGVIEKMLG